MGFPTFTFETDDDQFLPGTFEDVNDRLGEELDVMRYLINNIWYWRARLVVDSFSIEDEEVTFSVNNMGRASTRNATLQYVDGDDILWESDNFTANASSITKVTSSGWDDLQGGEWRLSYQKRVVHSSQWVNESVELSPYSKSLFDHSIEMLFWIAQVGAIPIIVVAFAFWWSREEKPFDIEDEAVLEAEIIE